MKGTFLILIVSIGIVHAQGDKRSTSTTRISTTRISTTRSSTSSSSPAINSSTISSSITSSSATSSSATGSSATTSSAASSTPTILPGWGAMCGGLGYTGPTTCALPYTCYYISNIYSACQ
ncbi:hypothetical protein BDV93DRAFT_562780 [Ceratobasidium sp. AG-I]|nr:hypothetical protein BDV93DRAFT_562780 [Ceratobasidium sp. AG-I]